MFYVLLVLFGAVWLRNVRVSRAHTHTKHTDAHANTRHLKERQNTPVLSRRGQRGLWRELPACRAKAMCVCVCVKQCEGLPRVRSKQEH